MLEILLAEHSDGRIDHVEQLANDREHAGKMPRTVRAAKLVGLRRRLHQHALRNRIDGVLVRSEQDVATGIGECPGILSERARIAIEVLSGAELQAVDEDAGDHGSAELAGAVDESKVAVMQVAHGRHEHGAPLTSKQPAQFSDRVNGPHQSAARRMDRPQAAERARWRRVLTAWASCRSSGAVSSQQMQASVID